MASSTASPLHFTLRSRLDELKSQCQELCGHTKPTNEALKAFFSTVQLWKERSLHQTLETLDKSGVSSVDCHVEAMETHERTAQQLFEVAKVFLDNAWFNLRPHLDTFGEDLSGIVDNIVTSKLDEQQIIHDKAVNELKEEIQTHIKAKEELKKTQIDLEKRLEVLENTSGAGDVILCNKLRTRCQHLAIRTHELSLELEKAAEDRLKHRRELEKTKTQLFESQKTLALTKAMHDKETRQLAALVQLNHAQISQVLKASRDAPKKEPRQQSLERFDPLSGSTIVHLTPQKPKGLSSSASRRASSPFSVSPRRERPKSATSRPRTASKFIN